MKILIIIGVIWFVIKVKEYTGIENLIEWKVLPWAIIIIIGLILFWGYNFNQAMNNIFG